VNFGGYMPQTGPKKNFFDKLNVSIADVLGTLTKLVAGGIKEKAQNMFAKDTKFLDRVKSLGAVVINAAILPVVATAAVVANAPKGWKGFKGLFSRKSTSQSRATHETSTNPTFSQSTPTRKPDQRKGKGFFVNREGARKASKEAKLGRGAAS
jgi:hypothetical protein